jgi:crossover junction endodeoxyribonuclease RusA
MYPRNADHSMAHMPQELALVLPLPPSINHQYATVQGRRVLSRAGREYKQLVAEEVQDWIECHQLPEAAVGLFRRHYLALTLRRDLDSGLKIAQDALCEALGVNDNLVVEIHLSKRVDRNQPRIEVLLTALPAEAVDLPRGEGGKLAPLTSSEPRRQRRRRLRRRRSLEELARRYNWE